LPDATVLKRSFEGIMRRRTARWKRGAAENAIISVLQCAKKGRQPEEHEQRLNHEEHEGHEGKQ
jgi:hypothetical protein